MLNVRLDQVRVAHYTLKKSIKSAELMNDSMMNKKYMSQIREKYAILEFKKID